jgi:hypothetical protein
MQHDRIPPPIKDVEAVRYWRGLAQPTRNLYMEKSKALLLPPQC